MMTMLLLLQAMEILMDAGADINCLNKVKQSCLHTACSTGQRNAVKLLLTKNPAKDPDCDNLTPLGVCLQVSVRLGGVVEIKGKDFRFNLFFEVQVNFTNYKIRNRNFLF